MKKIFALILLTFSLELAVVPVVFAQAQAPRLDYSGFVKCDGVVKGTEAYRQQKCNFAALIDTIIKAINWMFYISIPVAAVLFAYGGFLYMTGKSGNIETAKKIFASVAIGFIIMITAWIGVRQFVEWFVDPNSGATTLVQ